MNINDNPVYVGDIIPSVATYQKAINIYKKGLKSGDFYEEPIGDDFTYPDWWIFLSNKLEMQNIFTGNNMRIWSN